MDGKLRLVSAAGRERRSCIGAAGRDIPLSRRSMRHHDLEAGKGFLVTSVGADSPAARAGVKEGEIIVAFNGCPIAGVDGLHRLLGEEQSGVKSILALIRRTGKREVEVVPGERKAG